MKKVLKWIGLGLAGAATVLIEQLITNKQVESDVADYINEHKDELFATDEDEDED